MFQIRVNGDLNDKLFDEPERREVIAGGRKYYGPQGPPGADGQDGAAGPQVSPSWSEFKVKSLHCLYMYVFTIMY